MTIRLRVEMAEPSLEVTDNGTGISDQAISSRTSVGLARMRELALSLRGALTIAGRPGAGTTVTLRMPLKRR